MTTHCNCGTKLNEDNRFGCVNVDGFKFEICDDCRKLCDYGFCEHCNAYTNDCEHRGY